MFELSSYSLQVPLSNPHPDVEEVVSQDFATGDHITTIAEAPINLSSLSNLSGARQWFSRIGTSVFPSVLKCFRRLYAFIPLERRKAF
jgi:hypothetical protein